MLPSACSRRRPTRCPGLASWLPRWGAGSQWGPTAGALPGFGFVAPVLGIVITMGAIDGPVEEVGEKVGAALVGTFLGILLSYGFVQPISVQMDFLAAAEIAYFRTIASMLEGFA